MSFIDDIKERAKKEIKTIVLPEATDIRTLKAVDIISKDEFCKIVLVGIKDEVVKLAKENNINVAIKLPLIILRSPKGWTGPKYVDGKKVEGTFRSHQVPIQIETEKDLELLSSWLSSYKPDELFDEDTEDLLLEPEIKRYSLSLIYADLYEHAMNQKMSHSENEKENIASFLPILIVSFSMQVIPNDVEVRNRLLKHFILLQDDKEQMKDNRINTYKNEKFITLSKYNPYFTGDENRY